MIAYTPRDIRALARLVKITIFLFLQKSVVFEKNSLYNFSITTSKKSAIFYIIYRYDFRTYTILSKKNVFTKYSQNVK